MTLCVHFKSSLAVYEIIKIMKCNELFWIDHLLLVLRGPHLWDRRVRASIDGSQTKDFIFHLCWSSIELRDANLYKMQLDPSLDKEKISFLLSNFLSFFTNLKNNWLGTKILGLHNPGNMEMTLKFWLPNLFKTFCLCLEISSSILFSPMVSCWDLTVYPKHGQNLKYL